MPKNKSAGKKKKSAPVNGRTTVKTAKAAKSIGSVQHSSVGPNEMPFTGSFYIGDVNVPVVYNGAIALNLLVRPSMVAESRLAVEALRWDSYRIDEIKITATTSTSTAQLGKIGFFIMTNPNESLPDSASMLNAAKSHSGNAIGSTWMNFSSVWKRPGGADKRWKTVPGTGDIDEWAQCRIIVYTWGSVVPSTDLSTIGVEMRGRFFDPSVNLAAPALNIYETVVQMNPPVQYTYAHLGADQSMWRPFENAGTIAHREVLPGLMPVNSNNVPTTDSLTTGSSNASYVKVPPGKWLVQSILDYVNESNTSPNPHNDLGTAPEIDWVSSDPNAKMAQNVDITPGTHNALGGYNGMSYLQDFFVDSTTGGNYRPVIPDGKSVGATIDPQGQLKDGTVRLMLRMFPVAVNTVRALSDIAGLPTKLPSGRYRIPLLRQPRPLVAPGPRPSLARRDPSTFTRDEKEDVSDVFSGDTNLKLLERLAALEKQVQANSSAK